LLVGIATTGKRPTNSGISGISACLRARRRGTPRRRDETGKVVPIDVQAGDRILFRKWSGTEVKIDGVEHLIMKESDVMGVLVNEKSHKRAA
jgi:Chaperonin 10 Kd subunit